MNTALLSELEKIRRENGIEAFDDIKLVGRALSKNAAVIAQPEYDVLMLCLMADYHKELIGAGEALRDSVKESIAERLHGNEGIDAALCNSTLDTLEAALFDENEPVTKEKEPEIPDIERLINEKDNFIETLTKENNKLLERLNKEMDKFSRKNLEYETRLEKTKTGLIAAIVTGLAALIISIAVGHSQYDDLRIEYYTLMNSNSQLQTKYDTLMKDFNTSKKIWVVNVTTIKVGNSLGNGVWLTEPGGTLYASKMRYLTPVITYNSLVDRKMTFYTKIIAPDGRLFDNPSISPKGYSNSNEIQVNRGNDKTLRLRGWGNDNDGTYEAGQWTVEVWYNDVCLRSEKVTIRP
jgi:hypothetical protein